MPAERGAFYTNLLQGIEKGLGKVELDRGGYWSKDYSIWVDRRFSEFIRSPLLSSENKYIETLGSIGLSVGRLFNRQLHDANNGVMWPKEVFEDDGAEKLLAGAERNSSILNPYSLISGGLESPSVPYSIAYADELARLNKQLSVALELGDSPSAKAHAKYLSSLIKAYTFDPKRTDDTKYMEVADKDWVNISPDAPLLIFVEPTEVYHDPARVALAPKPEVAKLANKVADENGLGLWRPFFEFRLLVKDESMVKKEEIEEIRKTSRKLYATQSDVEVPVSLEFRRLLLASGNGAHPAKTAKNYPNFEQIRDKDGYKNVLYTNMIEEGTLTQLIPTLRNVFDEKIVNQFSEQQLVRGTSLRVVAHEENHPFRRFRDTPLEELKATVNGIKTIIESGQFTEEDINAVLLTEIGAALGNRSKMVEARNENDINTQTALEGYYKGDTIFMNYLIENGGLVINDKGQVVEVDFKLLKENSIKFANYLEAAREGEQKITIPKIYEDFYKEKVWDNFSLSS